MPAPVGPLTFNNNIPQSSDLQSTSQGQLLINNQSLQTYLQADHAAFANVNSGFHTQCTFPDQNTNSPVTASANQIVIYSNSKNSSPSGVIELWIDKPSASPIPFTASLQALSAGWSYEPSGLLRKWGTGTLAAGTANISLAFGPAFNNVFNIQLTYSTNIAVGTSLAATNILNTSFTVNGANGIGTFFWMVLGN